MQFRVECRNLHSSELVPRQIRNGQQDQAFICLAGRNGKVDLPDRLGPVASSHVGVPGRSGSKEAVNARR